MKFHEITGDERPLKIALDWFKDRFEIGTTKVIEVGLLLCHRSDALARM